MALSVSYLTASCISPGRLRHHIVSLLVLLCAGVVLGKGLEFTERLFQWVESEYGHEARDRVEQLQQLIAEHSDGVESRQLKVVNDFFNRVGYDSDNDLWDRKDYWATPFEVLGVNSADCEDYALSKYFALISMGMPEEKLRITYVKAIVRDEAHMVLAYYPEPDAEPLILDNLKDEIRLAGDRQDLVPVYSFNGTALWLAVNRVEGREIGDADRIEMWRKFQDKLQEQMVE